MYCVVYIGRARSSKSSDDFAAREFGGVDVSVQNAGIISIAKVEDLTEQEWEEAEELMQWAEGVAVEAQTEVWQSLPTTGKVRKNWYSTEYVEIARKARRRRGGDWWREG